MRRYRRKVPARMTTGDVQCMFCGRFYKGKHTGLWPRALLRRGESTGGCPYCHRYQNELIATGGRVVDLFPRLIHYGLRTNRLHQRRMETARRRSRRRGR